MSKGEEPAFPKPNDTGYHFGGSDGMSLREWYIGQSLAGLFASGQCPDVEQVVIWVVAAGDLTIQELTKERNPTPVCLYCDLEAVSEEECSDPGCPSHDPEFLKVLNQHWVIRDGFVSPQGWLTALGERYREWLLERVPAHLLDPPKIANKRKTLILSAIQECFGEALFPSENILALIDRVFQQYPDDDDAHILDGVKEILANLGEV